MGDINQNFSVFNIDTKGLEKPAVLLIEKLSNACGATAVGLARGGQYLYDTARVLNSSDVSDSLKQVLSWDMANKVRKHGNLNKILSRAVCMLSSKASEETIGRMDDDKINYIMEKAAMVSDAAMQDVWAKLISGEAENPGKFSRQAVNIVSVMDKKDAEVFTKMGQFVTDNTSPLKRVLLIYNVHNDIYKSQGIHHGVLSHLQSLGLIYVWDNNHSFSYPSPQMLFHYRDSCVEVSPPFDSKVQQYILDAGQVSLTPTGEKILSLAEPERNPEFWKFVIKEWEKLGVNPRSVKK